MNKERLEEIKESWKDIEGYEGCYQVSNLGNVKSFKNDSSGRLLSPKFNGNYNQIRLCKHGVCSMFSIHRLVAFHFVDNPLNKEQVNHKDGDKTNNNSNNLEWVTHSENGLHAYETNLRVSQKGEQHGRAKLSKEDVLSIYSLAHTGKFKQKEIANMFDIRLATVSDIKLGKRWGHITSVFEQAERVQELEEIIKQADYGLLVSTNIELVAKNKRMREAIESARDEQEVHQRLGGSIDNDVVRILDEAIKPWRVKHNE